MRRVGRIAGVSTLALALSATAGTAQNWRTVTGARQVRGEEALRVNVRYAAGHLALVAGDPGTLYRWHLQYDADRFESATAFDPATDRLRIGVTTDDLPEDVDLSTSPQALQVALSPAVPLTLDLEFGMAIAELDLGGLALASAHIKTGGSESRIVFSAPNRISCDRLEIAVGAAELHVTELGNAHCRHIDFTGGAGEMLLDFSGAWTRDYDTSANVTVGLGSLTLQFPSQIGVSVEMTKLLAGFEDHGFERRGSRFVSPGYDRARVKLDVRLHAVLGDVNVKWLPAADRGR